MSTPAPPARRRPAAAEPARGTGDERFAWSLRGDRAQHVDAGGTVIDPEVVRQLLGRRRDPIDRLTPREREVLALMAEGWSNGAIARTLVVTEAAVAKHIGSILTKLDLPPAEDDHRRVRAVLAFLRA